MIPPNLDISSIEDASTLEFDDAEEERETRALMNRAEAFLRSFSWCSGIKETYLGIVVPGVLGVFLFHISPATTEVDEYLWVVVGDLPPAYLVTDDAPNPSSALTNYVAEMRTWVDAVRRGDSTDGLIPVNAPATLDSANELASRLDFLTERILKE